MSRKTPARGGQPRKKRSPRKQRERSGERNGPARSNDAIRAASSFAQAGQRTPVFVRLCTVMGEHASPDTARNVRGFAVKFYTGKGDRGPVNNIMPLFFIQYARARSHRGGAGK